MCNVKNYSSMCTDSWDTTVSYMEDKNNTKKAKKIFMQIPLFLFPGESFMWMYSYWGILRNWIVLLL